MFGLISAKCLEAQLKNPSPLVSQELWKNIDYSFRKKHELRYSPFCAFWRLLWDKMINFEVNILKHIAKITN